MGFTKRGAPFFSAVPAMFSVVVALTFALAAARPADAAPALSSRAACEAALTLEQSGRPTVSSRGPCHSAFIVDGAPRDMRNEVASLMSPGRQPSLDDLVIATLVSDAAVRKAADQPWGYLARCDIARRLGSADVLETCLADLRRVAPTHPASAQALAFATERASWGAWLLRVLFLAALLGTLAHALWRRERPARRPAPAAPARPALLLVVVCSLLSGFGAGVARAAAPTVGPDDQLSKLKIDDANPEASVPDAEVQNKRPLEFGYYLQDLAAKAEKAASAGDHAAEARFYRAMTKAAPTSSFAPRKLCQVLETANDIPNAIIACRTTLTREGATVADYQHFLRVVFATSGALPAGERAELDAVITHLTNSAQLGSLPVIYRCEIALRYRDTAALAACTQILAQVAPNDPKTISFQWALALQRHDQAAALRLVDRARGVGISKDGLARMEEATRQMNRRRLEHLALLALGAALLAALLAVGYRYLAQRRRVPV